jgi:hypothetical protein
MSIDLKKRDVVVNSQIICHGISFGIPDALRHFPEVLKGNKNRVRIITRIIEQKIALNEKKDVITDALTFDKKLALKLHKDFCPGDKNRSHKLARILKKKKNTENSRLKAHATLKLPLEVSTLEVQRWMSDTSLTLRRHKTDPLPCRMHRQPTKIPFYEEIDMDYGCLDRFMQNDRSKDFLPRFNDNLTSYDDVVTGQDGFFLKLLIKTQQLKLLLFSGFSSQLEELWRRSMTWDYACLLGLNNQVNYS